MAVHQATGRSEQAGAPTYRGMLGLGDGGPGRDAT